MAQKDELTRALLEACRHEDGRATLACADAFKLAKRLGVTLRRIGRVCDQENIKICTCQLGCFE